MANLMSRKEKYGAPGVIRTPDLRFRKPLLYPAELRDRMSRFRLDGSI